ncbi:MAG: TetR/AcrR family transcriptional regulator [Spirochaetota bacterium]|nr:TetR/AcrR family transcriptional regulator [Spirochaetota bacterium]
MSSDKKNMSTRDRIFEAAVNLFSTKGYHGTSIREIAREVGIKESSIYNHFTGKDGILEAILEYYQEGFRTATSFLEEMEEFMEGFTDPVDLWLAAGIEFMRKLPPYTEPISRILMNEMFLDERCRRFVLHSMFTAQKEVAENSLRYLRDRGLIRDCDIRQTAVQYVYMLQGLDIENRLMRLEGHSPEELQAQLMDTIRFFIEGLRIK